MQPIYRITDEEFELIEDCIKNYTESGLAVDICYILREWNTAKNHLYQDVFGGQLILKRQITYSANVTEIVNEMYQACDLGEIPRDADRVRNQWRDFCHSKYLQKDGQVGWLYASDIIDFNNLVEGKIATGNFSIDLPKPDGTSRVYNITSESKPFRVMRRIIKAFPECGISEEAFRHFSDWVTTFSGSKEIHGNLCLSIHPMDYITMSDNNCDWSSCMSWEDNGCYRGGTVEMMNSPMVVVAYLESSTPMHIFGKEWNSKKWRTLLIVNPKFLCSIKSYPFQQDHLTKIALDWVNELCHGKYTEKSYDVCPWRTNDIELDDSRNIQITIEPHCNRMYNDFGSTTHWMKIDKNEVEEIYESRKEKFYDFNYSGASECMTCGKIDGEFSHENDEEALSCLDCFDPEPTVDCYYCGESFHEDDMLWVEDECFCPNCAADPDIIQADKMFGEYCRTENIRTVKFVNHNDEYKIVEGVGMNTLMTLLDTDLVYRMGLNLWRRMPKDQPVVIPTTCIKEIHRCYLYDYRKLMYAIGGEEFAYAGLPESDRDSRTIGVAFGF